MIELFDSDGVADWLRTGGTQPASFVGVDLRPFEGQLEGVNLVGCNLLGCAATARTRHHAFEAGAILIDDPTGVPFHAFRSYPYSVPDLHDRYDPADPAGSWLRSFDHQCFTWFMAAPGQPRALGTSEMVFARLHDTMQETALARFIDSLRTPAGERRLLVGFMGGHDAPRTIPTFRSVSEMARTLCREGYVVVSGGGPGLMEAANLGAFLAPFADDALGQALEIIGSAPLFTDPNWLRTAFEARAQILGSWNAEAPPESTNLGIPTWLYGQEPPNVFSTHISKLFFNSLREDGLVTIASGGIVFGKGNAGTVQEVFQDACQNYYRGAGVTATPMALFERDFWTRPCEDGPDPKDRKKPLWPLLDALSREKPASDFSTALLVDDDPDRILRLIRESGIAATEELVASADTIARQAASPFLQRHGYA